MARKVIHTPDLLAAKFGLTPPINDVNEPALQVKYKSVTSEGVKREKLEKKRVNEEVQLGGLATPKPPPPTPSPDPTPSPTGYNDTYDTKYTYKTRPSQFEFNTVNYNDHSKNDKQQRSLSSIQAIVLHHTAHFSYKDKGYESIRTGRGFLNNYKSSHAVMDGAGHIEYMIPIRYVANTQGIIYTDKRPKPNIKGISIEIQNVGWVKKQDKIKGIQYYGRGNGTYKNAITEDQISRPYDFNGNMIKGGKYKGVKYFEEYTPAQMDALAGWIKEMMKATGITWKFTQDTYNAMFPNKQMDKLPLKRIFEKHLAFVAFKKGSTSKVLGRGKYGGWAVSKDFYKGVRGVYTHCSVVQDKIDLGPTYNIIKMLRDNFM